jgi:hypothetical protein
MTGDLDLQLKRWSVSWREQRRHRRQELLPSVSVELQRWRADLALGPVYQADLLDLSEGGACLAIANDLLLQPGEQAQLRIPATTGEPELHRVCVRWRDDAEMIAAIGVQFLDSDDATA